MKECRLCKKTKIENEFYFYSGKYSSRCKLCLISKIRIYQKTEAGIKSRKKSKKKYKLTKNGKEIERISRERWKKRNPEKCRAYQHRYETSIRGKKLKKEYRAKKRSSDPNYKIIVTLRKRLWKALNKGFKHGSAVESLGCTIQELREHIEKNFQPGMSWNNHGLRGWHIDHIKPLSSFDLTDREQFLQACHYTNLQPLWAKDNLVKGSK